MRRQWFMVNRFSAKENPANLNTKALSKKRKNLIKRIKLSINNVNIRKYLINC